MPRWTKKSGSLTVYFSSELYALQHLIGNAYLAWSYRAAYRPMLAARVTPAVPEASSAAGTPARAHA